MDELYENLAGDVFLREPVSAKIRPSRQLEEKNDNPALKVEMQTLRLNSDSQKMVLDTLRYLHGPDFQLGSSTLYKDKKSNLGHRYWMERGNLIVQGGIDYSMPRRSDKTPEEKFRQFALKKLESYGFHKPHCAEALDIADGSIDKALHILHCKYFDIDPDKEKPEGYTESDILEQRDDEKAVLESIYENDFQVKEFNAIWNFSLQLDYIVNLFAKTTQKPAPSEKENINYNNKNNNFKTKKKEVCRNFKRGTCTFAGKCRFLHQNPDVPPIVEVDDTKAIFELEIRFPEGCLYPLEPPLLILKTVLPVEKVPDLVCLKITNRLMEEAKLLANDCMPSIYSVVELLKNEEEIVNYLKFYSCNFPDIQDLLFPLAPEAEATVKESLPSHYKKAKARDSRSSVNVEAMLRDDREIAKCFLETKKTEKYKKMLASRKNLPAWAKRAEILDILNKSQVMVISGETGCGKSTQVPQYILDNWLENMVKDGKQTHAEVICTQPRRISAIGVADRVAEERIERTGTTIGYQIRLENKISSRTRLTFCTTGILLRRLEYDPRLTSVTHVIVDEVHERTEESDFLLLILKDLIAVRSDLKVILMSATLNAELFSQYFGGIPVLEIPGRTFPVEELFLEDIMDLINYTIEENSHYTRKVKKADLTDLETELQTCDLQAASNIIPNVKIKDENLSIAQMIARYPVYSKLTCKNLYLMDTEKINLELVEEILKYIVEGDNSWPKEGAILVFLPGIGEIMSLYDQLNESRTFTPKSGKFILVPLHSTLSSEEQAAVFQRPQKGVRKIVLSTNIAETSVTIDDCVFVIDCGKMKEKRFDWNRNMESLDMVWVSRANAKQRKGRAGRVMPGVCVHLYTSHRHHYHLLDQPVPEIHRVPLEQLLLKVKILPLFEDMDVHKVLGGTIEPPTKDNIDSALVRLHDVGAIDKDYDLTPLGKHLAALPVDVRIGKLMLFGAIFCCVDSALTMAACLSYKNPFVAPFGKKDDADKKKREFAVGNSDQLTILKAYKKWREAFTRSRFAGITFASENFLSNKTLIMLGDIKHQLLGLLVAIGFVPDIAGIRKKYGKDNVYNLTGPELNANGENDRLLAAILCAALYPNVVKVLTPEKSFHVSVSGAVPRQPKPEELRFKTKTDGYVALHPSSVNYTVSHYTSPYLVYQEKVKTSRVFIRDCSMVPQLPLVLFSGCELGIELHDGTFVVSLEDGWIMFQVEKHEIAEMLKTIRIELINLLEEKINDPSLNLLHHEKGNRIIHTIVHIITRD